MVPYCLKIPSSADWLIKTALLRKYHLSISLTKLDDSLVDKARQAMFKRLDLPSLVKTA